MKVIGLLFAAMLVLVLCGDAAGDDLYFVDAHSQMAKGLDPEAIVPFMDKAGVRVTILSARNDRDPDDILELARKHPGRIIPAVRTKGKAYRKNDPKFYPFLEEQLSDPGYKAMAEVLLYHAKKGNKAPEISVFPDEPQAQAPFRACIERGWPFVAHIEYKGAGANGPRFMSLLEEMMVANPEHPFLLMHSAQLDPGMARDLLAEHPNLHIIPSHGNEIINKNKNQPWTVVIENGKIKPEWRDVMEDYPDRFVLAFDLVWAEDWDRVYLEQAALWRSALLELPAELAHAIAHGNAERLWNMERTG